MLKLLLGGAGCHPVKEKTGVWIAERMPLMVMAGYEERAENLLKIALENDKSSRFVFLLSEDIITDTMDLFVLSTQLRSAFSDCNILFLNSNKDFLLRAVNANIMPSGFLPVDYIDKELYLLMTNVYEQYMKSQNKRVLTAYVRGVYHNILYDEIEYIESAQKKIKIVTTGGCIEYADTLQNLEMKLDSDFLRCHNSYLVNTTKIKSINWKDGTVFLYSGSVVYISRKYQDRVEQFVKKQKAASNKATQFA